MWLDPPVITRDGDTLRIVREAHWDFAEWSICVALALWLSFGAFMIHAASAAKRPPALILPSIGLLFAGFVVRLALFRGETISVDFQKLQNSRNWAGRSKTRQYGSPSEVFTASRLLKHRTQHWMGFQCGDNEVWVSPTMEEYEVQMMLEALQEHLVRQTVQ